MQEYYTYMLINPIIDLPFYIGKGKDKRAYSHLLKYDPHNHRKSRTIEKIRKNGKEPVVCILKENISNKQAKDFEIKLINYYGKYNNGGILTNIADGGIGGYTGSVSEKTSEKLSIANAGEKNSNAKLTSMQVKEIYYRSDKTLAELSREYNIGRPEILKIKLKTSWKPVTSLFDKLPGIHYKNRFKFFTDGELKKEIRKIFNDPLTNDALSKKYKLGSLKINNIKKKKIYSKYTHNLILPEDIIYYGMALSIRGEIQSSTLSYKELSKKFNIHVDKIRNIKNNYYR